MGEFKDSAEETKDLFASATGLAADAKDLELEEEEAEEEAEEAQKEADEARENALKMSAELAKQREEQQKKLDAMSNIPLKDENGRLCRVWNSRDSIVSAGDGQVKSCGYVYSVRIDIKAEFYGRFGFGSVQGILQILRRCRGGGGRERGRGLDRRRGRRGEESGADRVVICSRIN